MSLVNILLGQKNIVLILGLAALMLVAAIGMSVLPRIRSGLARAARERAEKAKANAEAKAAIMAAAIAEKEKAAAVVAEQVAPAPVVAEAPAPESVAPDAKPSVAEPANGSALGKPVPPQVAAPATPATPAAPAAAPTPAAGAKPTLTLTPEPAPNADAAKGDKDKDKDKGDKAGGGMQDLLSSVFGNEEANARYEILMRGLERVSAADLDQLSTEIANQLRARDMARAEEH